MPTGPSSFVLGSGMGSPCSDLDFSSTLKVRAMLDHPRGMLQPLFPDSSGMNFRSFSSVFLSHQVWVSSPLLFWLPPFPVEGLSCSADPIHLAGSRVGVSCVCLSLVGLPDCAIYYHVFVFVRVLLFWELVFILLNSIMASSSPSCPQSAQCDDPPSAVPMPQPLPPIGHVATSRLSQPASSNPASFSEALILGVGGQSSNPSASAGLNSPSNQPAEAPAPSQWFNMQTLCLLGKPWGEAIPLAIVISKTRKDWNFVKGQIDYVELGNG